MADVSLTQHFTYTVNGVTYTDGSLTTAQTYTIDSTQVFDKTYRISVSTVTELLSCGAAPDDGSSSDNLANFDFLWIKSDLAGEIQFLCNEGGTVGSNNLEDGMVFKVKPNIPFILVNDDSRTLGDCEDPMNESNYLTEIDLWEDTARYPVGVIDRIEWYHSTGTAIVRVVAFT